jgi:hypothetical protein
MISKDGVGLPLRWRQPMGTAQQFSAEEIALANWLGDDEVKSILRSMAYNAPKFEFRREAVWAGDREVCVPTGTRYDRLKTIWDRYHVAVWAHADATDSQALAEYFLFSMPRPEKAVSAMLSLAPLIKRVAVIAKRSDPVAAGRQARAA